MIYFSFPFFIPFIIIIITTCSKEFAIIVTIHHVKQRRNIVMECAVYNKIMSPWAIKYIKHNFHSSVFPYVNNERVQRT